MASKFPVNTILLLRKSYAVAAENVIVQQHSGAAAVMRNKVPGDLKGGPVAKEEFWMRDPKTGNWIPESQFNQIDVADLREKFLSKKNYQ